MRSDFQWSESCNSSFCELELKGANHEPEIIDLFESLDSFQSLCNAGFFTDEPRVAQHQFIILTSEQYNLNKQWNISRPIVNAGKCTFFNLLRGYETGEGPLLIVQMTHLTMCNSEPFNELAQYSRHFHVKKGLPFELSGDVASPLGWEPVIRIEFTIALLPDADIDKWFSALRAWERIILRHGFDGHSKSKCNEPWSSELFMQSPNVIEYSLHGIEPSGQAIVAMLRFLKLQAYEHGVIRHVTFQS